MKILVIGANGQLGNEICDLYKEKNEVTGLTHNDIEIADIDDVKTKIFRIKPDVVINTAAYHNVPLCEENPALAFAVNGAGSLNLAKVCEEQDCTLVQYSTDYVFDGVKGRPYVEGDVPNPLNVYGVTKLTGEYFVRNYCRKHYVIRISGIYGKVPCRAKGGNFITTMMNAAKEKPVVKVVNDEILTPTSVEEIAKNTMSLLGAESYGMYHMTAEGECSWYEFARVIFETLKLETPLVECSVADFPSVVKRPFYSVLENSGLKKLNINDMPHWRDSLTSFLKKNILSEC